MKRFFVRNAALLAMGLLTAVASARGLDDFTLARAIPADAALAVHTRGHDGQAFLNKQMERIWAEVENARLDRDIKRLFKALAVEQGTAVEEFEANWQRMSDLAAGVDWANLASEEYGMGLKLGFPMPEYVVMFRAPSDKVGGNFEGLAGILKELAGLDPAALELSTDGEGESVVHRLSVVAAPFPVGFAVARRGDTIVMGFGTSMVEQSLAMLGGEEGETLASTDRFKAAFAKLPAPTDSAVYFDIAKFMGQLRGVIDQGMQMAPMPAPDDPGYEEAQAMTKVPGKILDRLDIGDYLAAVATTDGMKTSAHTIFALKEGAETKGLYKALFGNGTLENPLKYVPADAQDVSASTGINLLALYDEIIDVLSNDIPDGDEAIAGIASLKDEIGYDLREDILGWIKGNALSFSLPGASAYQSGEFAVLLGVRDDEKASTMIGELLDMVAAKGGEQLAVVEATIEGAEGFRSLKSPMLGMVGMKAPTLGVKDGWLWFGSSPEVVARSMAVASGSEENFSKNERFQKEGLPLGDQLVSMSFKDTTQWGEQVGAALGMVSMVSMFAPDVAKHPPVQALLSTVGKLGRVVRKVDFLLSSASQSTFDGRVLATTAIVNYREPPVIEKPKPPTSE
jgi:hypothetical protein